MECDEIGVIPTCCCLPPSDITPGGTNDVEILKEVQTEMTTTPQTEESLDKTTEQNNPSASHNVHSVMHGAVNQTIQFVCKGCVEDFCYATKGFAGTCQIWLSVMGILFLLVSTSCCCCCCLGSPWIGFASRRLRTLRLCARCLFCAWDIKHVSGDKNDESCSVTIHELEDGAALAIQKRVRGMQTRRKTAELVDTEHANEVAAVAIQKRVRGMQTRQKLSKATQIARLPRLIPGASMAVLADVDEPRENEPKVVSVTLKLKMRIKEAGEEGSHERAVFRIQLVRELAAACTIQKQLIEITSISAGSVVVNVDIHADPKLQAESKSLLSVAMDMEKQSRDLQSPLRAGPLLSKVEYISIQKHQPEQVHLQQHRQKQVDAFVSKRAEALMVQDMQFSKSESSLSTHSSDNTNGSLAKLSASAIATNKDAKSRHIKRSIITLHKQGRGAKAIVNHHWLLECRISEETVASVLREADIEKVKSQHAPVKRSTISAASTRASKIIVEKDHFQAVSAHEPTTLKGSLEQENASETSTRQATSQWNTVLPYNEISSDATRIVDVGASSPRYGFERESGTTVRCEGDSERKGSSYRKDAVLASITPSLGDNHDGRNIGGRASVNLFEEFDLTGKLCVSVPLSISVDLLWA